MHWLFDLFLDLLGFSWSWRFSVCATLGIAGIVAVYTLLPGLECRVYAGILLGAFSVVGGALWEVGHRRDDAALLRGEREGPRAP